jgi:phage/plasmid primase-like uncharacterized protein
MQQYRTAINPERLEKFAGKLGLTVASLNRLQIGWAFDKNAWAFPMVNAEGELQGIRLRAADGSKFAVSGGREGLFVPADLPSAGMLLFCEGPTTCAALLDMGFDVIGRPSCMSGVDHVLAVLLRRHRGDVVIVSDNDEAKDRPDGSVWYPGQEGAARLAQQILPLCRSVKIIAPAFHKDARDWKAAGATLAVVSAVIKAASYIRKDQNHDR